VRKRLKICLYLLLTSIAFNHGFLIIMIDKQEFKAYLVKTNGDDRWIGFIITNEAEKMAVYANTGLSSREKVVQWLIKSVPGITAKDEGVPAEIIEWAGKIALIRAGIDQDTGSIPLDLRDYTPKQRTVIETACRHIPVNEYSSYGRIAELAGLPGAARFVGSTMRTCRQPWIIPCQRVKNSRFIKSWKRGNSSIIRRKEIL
jgi:O6-methylguanine-DNA--protein-cysteine methyltransferase